MKNKFLTKLLCFVISIMMIVPTGISFVAASGEEDPFEALAAYGGYADTQAETNMQIYSNENNAPADVYLYDMTIAEEKATVDAKALTDENTKTVLDANPGARYVCIGNNDSAWKPLMASDGETEKEVMFTTKYLRNRPSSAWVGGSVYFKATDIFTKDDTDVTFIAEYLDIGTANIGITYVNSDFDGSKVSVSGASLPRTNTGKWVTSVVSVTDANIAVGLNKTALGDQKQTIKVSCGDVDTYISRFMVVKTSDYEKFLAGELGGSQGGGSQEGGEPSQPGNQPADPDEIDITEFNSVAVYVNSEDNADGKGEGLDVVSSANNAFNSSSSYNTDLIDLSVPSNMAAVQANANASANYAAHPEVGYANIGGAAGGGDGAWMVKDDSFFTSHYITARATTNWCAHAPGKIYLTVKDKLTKTDNEVTIIVEYLDEGEAPLQLQYTNTAFVDGSDVASATITDIAQRTDSGDWKRAVVQLDDANIAAGLKKTALADKAAQLAICANSIDTYIKNVYIMKTADYEAVLANGGAIGGGNDQPGDEPDQDLTAFEALQSYGTYVDADLHADGEGNGLDLITAATSQLSNYNNLILPITDPSYATAAAQTKANVASEPTIKYFMHGGNDAGTGFKVMTDGETEHNTFFTTRYATSRTDWCAKVWGSLYFTNTAKFTKDDNEVTFIVEYFDIGTKEIGVQYVQKQADGSVKTNANTAFHRTNTGTWKTEAVSVTDACVYEGIKDTVLADHYQSMRLTANGEDLYVSKFMVVKTSDYQKFLDGTLAQTDETVVSNAKASLKLNITETKENFTLPTVEGVTVMWKSDNSAIAVDGNNAVVTQGAADTIVKLTATITKGNASDTKVFQVKVPAKFGKAVGAEVIIGEEPEKDIMVGGIAHEGGNSLFKRSEPETATGKNLMYETELTSDWDNMRVLAGPENDKRWSVFTTTYYRPNRTNSISTGGNIPFNITEFSETDNTLTFEVDYLDVGTGAINILYVNDAGKTFSRTGMTRTNTGEWKTWTVTVDDIKISSKNAQSGLGKNNTADIRFEGGNDMYISRVEAYTSKAYKDIIGAKDALNIDGVTDENGIFVATGTVSTDFELPETVDGYDDAEVIWSSSNTDAIVFEGGKAKVFLSESGKQVVTITAAIVLDGCFVEKSFEVILAKKARTLYIAGDPAVTGEKTADANVAFDIKNLEGSMGKEVALIVSSIDEATDEIIAIKVARKTVESSTMSIDATVDNSKGRLCYYLTMDNGAVIYNIAPGVIKNFKVSSTSMGINITWDEPEDDYIFIKEYVLYDGNGNVVDTIPGDETSYFVPLSKNETKSYSLEGFDHAGLSTGKTEVKSGSLFKASGLTVKLYDLEGDGSNPALFNDYIGNPDTDNHSHKKVMKDAVTGEELECRHTLNRSAGVCTCGNKCTRSGGTFLYFKPDKTYVTAKTQEVVVIVKYFDYGTGKINVQYNKVGDSEAGTQGRGSYSFTLTGTNTFKTHVIKIYDAEFTSPSTLSNADIRFSGGPNGEIYFAEVTIMPLENYAEMPTPEIYIAGDSIASVYAEGNSRIGWGMELPGFLTNDVSVINKAVAGSSTKTFPNMDAIIANADKTDYVLISFGHNDSMANDRGVTVDEYKTNMINFINKITDKKATPVIITSIPQINHSNGTLIYDKQNPDGIMPYRDAAIEVAKIMGVNYIDLAGIMAEQAKDMTKEQVLALYEDVVAGKGDASHISKAGAEWVAGIIANELKAEKFGFISSYVK